MTWATVLLIWSLFMLVFAVMVLLNFKFDLLEKRLTDLMYPQLWAPIPSNEVTPAAGYLSAEWEDGTALQMLITSMQLRDGLLVLTAELKDCTVTIPESRTWSYEVFDPNWQRVYRVRDQPWASGEVRTLGGTLTIVCTVSITTEPRPPALRPPAASV
jgi:hypothetical protein